MNARNHEAPLLRARRQFLGRAGSAALLGLGASMITHEARAQSSDYRALVCVFLYGGNDGINMVPPSAAAAHARYASVRGPLAIERSQLLDLDGQIGLHPSMAPLQQAWAQGDLAVVCNVGPLARPTTLADYLAWRERNDNAFVPDSLYSHSDQQNLWENGHSDALVRSGWGGRLMEALSASPSIAIGKNTRFGVGVRAPELSLPDAGSRFGLEGIDPNSPFAMARLDALRAIVAHPSANRLHQAFAATQAGAFEASARLGAILQQAPQDGAADAANPEISDAFGHLAGAYGGPLSRQLYQVAKLVKQRSVVGGNRHVFFVALGGFDHHAAQLQSHAGLLSELATALSGFRIALARIGAADDVTAFTASDFGRTFKPNGSAGTDHAWGNQHLVLGGSVQGGRSYGVYPSLELGGPDDAGANRWEHQGRWIPAVSVDQYAATLIDWFSPQLGAGGLASVLPNLSRFPVRNLGFV